MKVQAQRDFLAKGDEDTVAAAAVQVQEDMQKQIDKIANSVNQLATHFTQPPRPPTPAQPTWPRPEQHFLPQLRMWGQPQTRYRPRKPNYNQAAEHRCWNCNRYGHFRAAYPERRPWQPPQAQANRRRVQQVMEEPNTLATRGSSATGQAYVYLAVICLMLPVAADAQRATMCQTSMPGQLFVLSKPMECKFSSKADAEIPTPMKLALYRHNLHKYDDLAWLCRGVKQTARLGPVFSEMSISKSLVLKTSTYTLQNAEIWLRIRLPPMETCQRKTGVWSTNNKLNWKLPSWGLPECCKWHYYETTNVFLVPAGVYKRYDILGFQSMAADVSNCEPYFSGSCQLGTEALV